MLGFYTRVLLGKSLLLADLEYSRISRTCSSIGLAVLGFFFLFTLIIGLVSGGVKFDERRGKGLGFTAF